MGGTSTLRVCCVCVCIYIYIYTHMCGFEVSTFGGGLQGNKKESHNQLCPPILYIYKYIYIYIYICGVYISLPEFQYWGLLGRPFQ